MPDFRGAVLIFAMNHLKTIIKCGHIRFLSESTKFELKKARELVPSKPIRSKIKLELLPPKTEINRETIALLERLSLVDCANEEGIKTVEDAIQFADRILQVETKGIEPLITVLEDRPLITREDAVTDGKIKDQILSNASVTEEEYFVAPPGNIPLTQREDLLHKESKDSDKATVLEKLSNKETIEPPVQDSIEKIN